jgi:hypothetical protein
MADFSNIDVEKFVVAWEEVDLWNISGKNYHKKRCKTQTIVQNPRKDTK